jgi:hypothetical protein
MLYPVEAERDVHDRKYSRQPSIGLSFYCAHRASSRRPSAPNVHSGAKAVFFPDGTTTVSRWEITMVQAS